MRYRLIPPVCFALMMTALLLGSGCSSVTVNVIPTGNWAPLPDSSPFRITTGRPPAGAKQVGRLAAQLDAGDAWSALSEIRQHTHRVGGNLVAFFRCQGIATFAIQTSGGHPTGPAMMTRARYNCRGAVYRTP